MPYTFIALDPRPQVRATEIAKLQDAPTLGIEVTIPEFAAECSLGNIDPQHSEPRSYVAAIDIVLYSMSWPLPPDGAQLATVRPDVDSVGAMAWLDARERSILVDSSNWKKTDRRVRAISDYDTFASGPWQPGERGGGALEMQVIALNAFCMDLGVEIQEKVGKVQEWLLHGDFDGFQELLVRTNHQHSEARASMQVRVDGDIAIVESTFPGRLPIDIGYEFAPIVILKNPAMRVRGGEPHLKYSVAVWPSESHRVNLSAVVTRLNEIELGWGGSPTMIGSPQGVASALSLEHVIASVRES